MSTINLEDIFITTYQDNKSRTFDLDPLVLSVAAKDLVADNCNLPYMDLGDPRVQAHVNDSHIVLAEEIRTYYSKKYFWNNLKDNRLSDFRQRASYLLSNRCRECKDTDIGIYYKLPFFFEEDRCYDDFKRKYSTIDIPEAAKNIAHLDLKYLKTTQSRQRRRRVKRVWFTDQTYLYVVEATVDNPLLPLFTQMANDNLTLSLDARYTRDRIDRMQFYKLFNFTLAKE